MNGNPLNREEIASLVESRGPLIENYVDLESQLQPNGFDLSLLEVARFSEPGQLGASDADRRISSITPLNFDADGWLSLTLGPYLVTFNEVVNLPPDLMALGRPAPACYAAASPCTQRYGTPATAAARSRC